MKYQQNNVTYQVLQQVANGVIYPHNVAHLYE